MPSLLLVLIALVAVVVVAQNDDLPHKELRGLWIGNEKFPYLAEGAMEKAILEYCTRTIFNPPGYGGGSLLDWFSAGGYCDDLGMNIFTGVCTTNFWQAFSLPEHYLEIVEEAVCVAQDVCDGIDVLAMDDSEPHSFEGWNVVAKSCGSNQRKVDVYRNNETFCDLWQVALLSREVAVVIEGGDDDEEDEDDGGKGGGKKGGSMGGEDLDVVVYDTEYILVLTDTYGPAFFPEDPLLCPSRMMFIDEELLSVSDADNIAGSAQYVLQQAYPDADFNPIDLFDVCNWACYDDPDLVCE